MTKKTRKTRTKNEDDIAVLDLETDPFKFGRTPRPFACGVRLKDCYIDFWGADCVSRALDFLSTIKTPLVIYAHNGGKFDFFYLWRALENPLKIINGRIVKARCGIHEFRDSWAIIPVALGKIDKIKIDYSKFEREVRELHKDEILRYLRGDCDSLYELCRAFVARFGFRLTIAGTAMRQLESLHEQKPQGEKHDERFRPYYFGGRVEALSAGVIHGDWHVYDVNSMYPYVMREYAHPIGREYFSPSAPTLDLKTGWLKHFPGHFYFIEIEGRNHGALPMRVQDNNGGLTFKEKEGRFLTSSHELRVALSLGLFEPTRIIKASIPLKTQRFETFVQTFSDEKIAAKRAKDKIAETFSKLILNSAYGRFGINPRDFYDYFFEVIGLTELGDFDVWVRTWELYQCTDDYRIWRKPAQSWRFADVAIAASITSAARSVLLRALSMAKRPVYCDTDSIICEGLAGLDLDGIRLGAWKLEARGNWMAIGGKKLYSLTDDRHPCTCATATDKDPCKRHVKSASKGVKIDPEEIERIARGGTFIWESDAPNFSLSKLAQWTATNEAQFTRRTARQT